MNTMHVLDQTGDTKIIWDRRNPEEVGAARATFNRLRQDNRYMAYKVQPGGDKGEIITEFDPEAEKIILAPPMVGG